MTEPSVASVATTEKVPSNTSAVPGTSSAAAFSVAPFAGETIASPGVVEKMFTVTAATAGLAQVSETVTLSSTGPAPSTVTPAKTNDPPSGVVVATETPSASSSRVSVPSPPVPETRPDTEICSPSLGSAFSSDAIVIGPSAGSGL
jgi:hypothetical protein